MTRREWLHAGYSGLLGLGLTDVLRGREALAADADPARKRRVRSAQRDRRADSVVLIFLTGGPSHIDTLDPKPDAPEQVRGEFKSIATKAAGMRICEHLPKLAQLADRFTLIRSFTHGIPIHEIGTHLVLSGVDKLPPGANHMATRNDWPCYASGVSAVRPRTDGIPNGVHLPTYLNNGYGFSGQNGGVLGPKHDPWQITTDPNTPQFQADRLGLPAGLTVGKLRDREHLLADMDAKQKLWERSAPGQAFDALQNQAFDLITSAPIKKAFDLNTEDPRLRDKYGRHQFGQSLLLARRLVQAGVPMIQANMGSMNNWDTHNNNCGALKERLLPPLDQAVSAFLEDLHGSGLLERTMVVMLGEFGRTPKLGTDNGGNITNPAGRDHWGGVFSALFAGGGVQGGQVLGKSDRFGAYPASRAIYPSDLGATIYQSLGIAPDSEVRDRLDRPVQLNRGQPIDALFTGVGI